MNNRLAVQHIHVAHEAPDSTFFVTLSSPKHRAEVTILDPSKGMVRLKCWNNRRFRHPLTTTHTINQIKRGMELPLTATNAQEGIFITKIERQHNGAVAQGHAPSKKAYFRRPFRFLKLGFSR